MGGVVAVVVVVGVAFVVELVVAVGGNAGVVGSSSLLLDLGVGFRADGTVGVLVLLVVESEGSAVDDDVGGRVFCLARYSKMFFGVGGLAVGMGSGIVG